MVRGAPEQVPDDGLTTRQRRLRPALIVTTGDGKGKARAAARSTRLVSRPSLAKASSGRPALSWPAGSQRRP